MLCAIAVRIVVADVQPVLQPIHIEGPTTNRINLVFLAEGYTVDQKDQFAADALRMWKALISEPPFSYYRTFFNAHSIFVPSVESGSDHPARNIFRDTYFNSTFDSDGTAFRLTIPPNDRDARVESGVGKIYDLLNQYGLLSVSSAVILVNDSDYGGSGGSVAIASMHVMSPELVLHEFGHSFAALGEEYEYSLPNEITQEAPNNTREVRRENIKWRNWIEPTTPVPTPETEDYADVIGLFSGAQGSNQGWYRPALDCKMRTLGAPFCAVCSEALILAFQSRVRLIDAASPIESLISASPETEPEFRVRPLQPNHHRLQVQWSLNGTSVNGATNEIFIPPANLLAGGENSIRVTVTDRNPLVRNEDLFNTDQVAWKLVWSHVGAHLTIARVDDEIVIQSPQSSSSVSLYESDHPNGPWKPSPVAGVQDGGVLRYRLPTIDGARFFRLGTATMSNEQ